jgi:rod shape-determining protein MreC
MTLKFRDKKQIARRRKTMRTIIGFVIFLILALVGFLSMPGGLLNRLGRPLWKTQNSVVETIQDNGFIVRTKSSVYRENEALQKENADLKIAMIDYQILKSENDQLKELFGRFPEKNTLIIAPILTRPNRSPYDTIIIDGGSSSGITEGDHVYAHGNIPLGVVEHVYDKTSLITLYSNPGYSTDALLESSQASVELIGRGGGNFEMTTPLDLPSEKGALVVLPGLRSEVIAIIEKIISIPTDPVKKVILRSPVNIQSLTWVEIKKN